MDPKEAQTPVQASVTSPMIAQKNKFSATMKKTSIASEQIATDRTNGGKQ